jgi:hypothetical protein
MTESKLGYSSLSEHVYWGKTNTEKPGVWIGNKKDVTDNFLNVILDGYLSKDSIRNICDDKGEIKYHLLDVVHTRESIDKAVKVLNDIKNEL